MVTDCLIIGYNDGQFEREVQMMRSMGSDHPDYRDLNFIEYPAGPIGQWTYSITSTMGASPTRASRDSTIPTLYAETRCGTGPDPSRDLP